MPLPSLRAPRSLLAVAWVGSRLAGAAALVAVAAVPAAQAQEAASLSGQLRSARGGAPVPGAVVRLDGQDQVALGDSEGRFAFKAVQPGALKLVVVVAGYELTTVEVELRPGERRVLEVELDPAGGASGSSDVMVIEERREPPEPVVRKISVEEIQRIPGTFGDAVRVVQNLPGVARSPFGLGFLIVRGTEPEDTGTYVDGIRVPLIFHFGGLSAVINSDMLERVEFLPGGYGARYGRTLGGVVDVSTKELRPEEPTGYADVDLIDTTLYYSRPAGETGGLTFSVRRSYVDAVVRPVLPIIVKRLLPEGANPTLQLPVYEDYQALYDTLLGDKHRLHILAFGSRDRFQIADGRPPASVDPLIVQDGNAGITVINHKVMARWTFVPNPRVTNRVTLGLGPDANRISVGAISINVRPFSIFLRDDLYLEATPWLRFNLGLDVLSAFYNFELELPFPVDTVELDPLGEPDADSLSLSGLIMSPSPYLEAELSFDDLAITPGVRLDPYLVWQKDYEGLLYSAAVVDPRLSARWRFLPKAALKGSVGRYSSSPSSFAVNPELGGDPSLRPEWAIQSSLGVEYRFTDNISIDGSVYRGDLRDLLTAPGSSDESRPTFVAAGGGVNQGLELLLRHDPTDNGFFGWVSYTLQKAERTEDLANACPRGGDEEAEPGCVPWVPFDFDQTHILTVVASQKLPRGWEVGLRFRYTTGTPYTPLAGGYYDVDDDEYRSVSGERNSLRFPPFHELDLRVDKRVPVKWGELSFALELLNVYNRQNPEAIQYSYDYSESKYVAGIPIFPAFGIKAKF